MKWPLRVQTMETFWWGQDCQVGPAELGLSKGPALQELCTSMHEDVGKVLGGKVRYEVPHKSTAKGAQRSLPARKLATPKCRAFQAALHWMLTPAE